MVHSGMFYLFQISRKTLEFRRATSEDEKNLLSDADNRNQSQMRLLHRLLTQVDFPQHGPDADEEETDFAESSESSEDEENNNNNNDDFYEM